MRNIKKYTNRKLYDTEDKKYISLSRVAELVSKGEEVRITDTKTGKDLTSATIGQILAREKDVPSSVLMQILQKGQGTFQDTLQGTMNLARRYVSLWQSAFSAAEGELDKIVNRMVKNNEIPATEVNRIKREMKGQAGSFKVWISDKIDQSVALALSRMNLAAKEQVDGLAKQLRELAARVDRLEKDAQGKKILELETKKENTPAAAKKQTKAG
ncbi:MAG: hypothetical protein JRI97_04490 [Deltaproteobacteria bacterium]|nr:hypothetical protein [Deltaproteobacteria bacterium]